MQHLTTELPAFLDRLLDEVEASGIDVSTCLLDHVCFRTVSADDYETTKAGFAALGKLLIEADVNGRPIATYRLHDPVVHRGRVVRVVEVPAPKPGKIVQRGWEHAEFVIGESFHSFAGRHPGLAFELPSAPAGLNRELALKLPTVNVKFHHLPLDGVIELERNDRLPAALDALGVFGPLARFQPQVSGSVPLGLAVAGSDVDVLFEAADLAEFERAVADVLGNAGWEHRRKDLRGRPSAIFRGDRDGIRFEWVAQTGAVHRQVAQRHLLVEARLLNVAGEAARQAIRDLKAGGLKTEPAFAEYFAMPGDPYEALLELETESEASLLRRFAPSAG